MVKKRFVVIGASDSNYGNFASEHWAISLKYNINQEIVDIVLLDYGLTKSKYKA